VADNVVIADGNDVLVNIMTDELGDGTEVQVVKLATGGNGSASMIATGNELPVLATSELAGVGIGASTDAAAAADGSLIAIVKQLRVLLAAGLPAALGANAGLKVDQLSQVARSRTVDAIAVAKQTDAIMSGLTALTPKWAFANVAASQTDSSIVAAVASKKIRVVSAVVVGGATATTIVFNTKPAGAGSAKTPTFANAANGGFVLGFNETGWFETASGEGLTVTTGAGATTGVLVQYVEV
jgi:hypothetical protein